MLRRAYALAKLTRTTNPAATAQLFTIDSGGPINSDYLARQFKKILRQAGLSSMRLYDLRHTAATLALVAGVPAKVVSEQLGHATSAFTLDVYSHVLPHMQSEAAKKVEVLLAVNPRHVKAITQGRRKPPQSTGIRGKTRESNAIDKTFFEVSSELSTRDQTGFEKTFSGLMKILYPDGKIAPEEAKELLSFSMEARRRVREHILRIDDTFSRHDFAFRSLNGKEIVTVLTPEEKQYPTFAAPKRKPSDSGKEEVQETPQPNSQPGLPEDDDENAKVLPIAQPGHIIVPENTKGWSYRRLFAEHLRGARRITVNDPYVRMFFQTRNLMEFLQMVHEIVPEGDEVSVELVTQVDRDPSSRQEENLNQIVTAFAGSRVSFSWKFETSPNFHARSITTDTGWKITIDRGLDIFQRFDTGPFSLEQGLQDARLTRGAEVTYLRV